MMYNGSTHAPDTHRHNSLDVRLESCPLYNTRVSGPKFVLSPCIKCGEGGPHRRDDLYGVRCATAQFVKALTAAYPGI